MSATTKTTTMTPTSPTTAELHDAPMPVRARLAAAWTAFMFFYIYVDYLHLYNPGVVDDIRGGVVFGLDINQTFVAGSLALVGIPALMIVLSGALPARTARVLNLVVAALYVPVSVFNLAGESWLVFYGLGALVEVLLLAYVARSAWTWPRTSTRTAA